MKTIIYTKEMQQQKVINDLEKILGCSLNELANNNNNNNNNDDYNATWLAEKYHCQVKDIEIRETTQEVVIYLLNNKVIYIE